MFPKDNKIEKISVIIPLYNSENYVREAILSVINQTLPPTEIIIVDDKSEDASLEIVRSLTQESDIIKLYELPQNSGISYARNYGIEKAQGEYILFLDSDDVAEPDLIQSEILKIQEMDSLFKKECVLIHSAYFIADEKGNVNDIYRWKQIKELEILGYLFIRNHISTSGVLVRKKYLGKSGGFNIKLQYSEDWDMWIKLAHYGGFGYVEKPLIRVRRHSGSQSSKLSNMLKGEAEVLKQYEPEYIGKFIYCRDLPYETNICDFVTVLNKLGHWDRGFELLEKLDKTSSNSTLHFLIGIYYLHKECYIKAMQSFELSIYYNGKNGAALNNYGVFLVLNGELSRARKFFSQAIEYFPGYIDAQHNLNLLLNNNVDFSCMKFTWRELRAVLTRYS